MIDHSGAEGDDYLQPKSRAPLAPYFLHALSSSPPSTPLKKFWPSGSYMTSDGSCAPQNVHNWNQERLRYAQAKGLDPNSVHISNSDGSSIRYVLSFKNCPYSKNTSEPINFYILQILTNMLYF